MAALSLALLETGMRMAEESPVKLEMVGGVPLWEAMPSARHQGEVFRIQTSIHRDAGIGSGREVELDQTITVIPEAVVEVISPGYESKDYQYGVPFYLSQGVKDVIVFDPHLLTVLHARRDGTRSLVSPLDIVLECGCRVTV